jgi:hypothetical protein
MTKKRNTISIRMLGRVKIERTPFDVTVLYCFA